MEIKYKDFSNSKIISYDIETYDPGINHKLGPSIYDGKGYVLGFSLADETGFFEYYNLNHYDCTKEEKEKNIKYLKEVMSIEHIPKLGANIQYDISYTEDVLGIKVKGQLYDIQIAQALIDENQKHLDLDTLGKQYLGEGKKNDLLIRFCEANNLKGDPRAWIYKMPYYIAREYGADDALKPVKIFKLQWEKLYNQDLLDVLHLECDLIRVICLMKKTGVKIDIDKRNRNALKTHNMLGEIKERLYNQYGEFNMNSSKQIARIFDNEGIKYPLTEKGNPSINTAVLKDLMSKEIELATDIFNAKKCDKHLNTFLMGAFERYVMPDGLIHASYFNTKIEHGSNGLKGTRSGRFSMADPNLQQIPSKGVDEFWGQICREVFVPFENCWWGKIDWSQIEYRFIAHFAVGPGSDEVRSRYNSDPNTDYHQIIIDLTGLKRRYAKNLNFGVAYGMGARLMAEMFGWTLEYCYSVLNTYHSAAPFIKATVSAVERQAIRKGFIKTFLGRRSRLLNKNEAYKMFCRLIQGSAADLMKKAMLDIYTAGIFDVLYPHITVHDELDVSVPKTIEGLEAFEEMNYIMENCVKLNVPIKADAEIGPNWADLEDYDAKKYKELINAKRK